MVERAEVTERGIKLKYGGPVIVIAGPTGSGKTGVAIEIAEECRQKYGYDVEIISADSRAIYKYMDTGTAKPTREEQARVQHWGIDLVEPGERFTVADWKEYTERKIEEIRGRGNVPMVVGGTGLYIDALVYNYQFRGKTGEKAGENASIEQKSCTDRTEMSSDYRVFGIKWETNVLRDRLAQRSEQLFCSKLYDETKFLVERYGWENQAMKSNIYQFVWKYLEGEISLEEAKRENVLDDYHLAKRQLTWFKRNDKIVWLSLDKMKETVLKCIQDG